MILQIVNNEENKSIVKKLILQKNKQENLEDIAKHQRKQPSECLTFEMGKIHECSKLPNEKTKTEK